MFVWGVCFREVRGLRRGFTAIELSIVLVLIAMVCIMLIPALERGHTQALRAKCIGRTRQVGFAFAMYQNDNDGAWPWARRSVSPGQSHRPDPTASLAALCPAYAPKVYLFQCPSAEDIVNLTPDKTDFRGCQNFYVSPSGRATRKEYVGRTPPQPPSYFYDGGWPSGISIPARARPERVTYGDECVHGSVRSRGGRFYWVGGNNHLNGGNFLFVDKHVEWLDVQWTGEPWAKGLSKPFVTNPHFATGGPAERGSGFRVMVDTNVFRSDWGGARREEDADLAGMMWLGRSWQEL